MENSKSAHNWLWFAALAAGISYLVPNALGWPGPAIVAWKGAGVALLALWCGAQARGTDGWLIALAMAFGATGDVLLETQGVIAGASAFLVGHVIAIILYNRHRRPSLTASQRILAITLVPVVIALAWMWTHDSGVAGYALVLALMGAMAWTSAFPRYRVGIGAMLFVISDLLIFARMGPLGQGVAINLAIWALYFGGQASIARGVVKTLAAK